MWSLTVGLRVSGGLLLVSFFFFFFFFFFFIFFFFFLPFSFFVRLSSGVSMLSPFPYLLSSLAGEFFFLKKRGSSDN